jgi:DNA-directed RNA polymerase specialized sigma24 family protein
MTSAEEATFIAMWQQGLEMAASAQHLGIPKGTVQSRAHQRQQQGKIQPRSRSGRPVAQEPNGAVRLTRTEDDVS